MMAGILPVSQNHFPLEASIDRKKAPSYNPTIQDLFLDERKQKENIMNDKENCNQSCKSCKEQGCTSRKPEKESLLAATNEKSQIKKVIGIVSGKGGVGKSLITSLLAVELQRRGYRVGILDGDITGPSIPKIFGLKNRAQATKGEIIPLETKTGIKVISINLLLEDEKLPVVWRGPMIANVVKQFWSDVVWGELDFLLVDMPPGTGDVPLTVFQSLPVDGIVIATSPQELVSMIVAKAVRMAEKMSIPILGIVENMSYVQCPDCGKKIPVFGESKIETFAQAEDLPVLGQIPLSSVFAKACDRGEIETVEGNLLPVAVDSIDHLL